MKTANLTRIALVSLVVLGMCGSVSSGWSAPEPVLEVNTEYLDSSPFLSFDGLTLYFIRMETDTFYFMRIFQATRPVPSGPFTSVQNISSLNYSGGHVGTPWVSQDNLRMYYYRTEPNSIWRLKVSERASTSVPWPTGVNISELNALGNVYAPSLTEDELTIFFVGYNVPGNLGTHDIWMANRPDRSLPFGNIRNLTEINTTTGDHSPFISSDGLTLYFHSSGKIFKATRSSLSEPFGNLEHLSFFDTPGGESGSPCPSYDGTAFYFHSKSPGEETDIYVSYSTPDTGPVAHWKFDEGAGSVAYDSAGGNDGTIYGAQWTTGIIGGALDFDGVDDYVEVPDDDSLTPSDQITISFWTYNRGVKQTGIYKYAGCPGEPCSPGNSTAYFLCVRDDTYQVQLHIHSAPLVYDGILSSNAVALNEWHYITGTFNQGNAAVYIDGQLENSDIITVSSIMNDVQPLIIGGFWSYCDVDTFHSTNGKIDDVRIYDRALSAAEVMELYAPVESGPIAHWKFDEGTGSVAYDSAGNNDGTLVNGPIWTTGIIDGALDFDGVDDYVETGDTVKNYLGTNYTVSAWIKANTTSLDSYIAAYRHSTYSYPDPVLFGLHEYQGDIAFAVRDNSSNYANALYTDIISTNAWYHVAGVRGGNNVNVYVNGISGVVDSAIFGAISVNNLKIGATQFQGNPVSRHFDGIIDDVRIYDRALSAAEIEELYQSGIPVDEIYHVDGINGSDLNDGRTKETAFATIQKGINSSDDGDTVLVWPGVYNETATNGINFKGKGITVKSAADAAVLEVPGYTAVSFVQGEDENSVFSNFVVRGSSTGIFALFANPTISNVTVVDNDNGIIADNANPEITNCILWNNTNGDLFGSPDPIEAKYSWFESDVNEPNMPTAGLISHWKFDEGSGLIAYDSAGNNDGVAFGATWTTSPFGNALDFDGVDDYVMVADDDSLDITDNITISSWVRPFVELNNQFIVAKWQDSEIDSSYGCRLEYSTLRFFLAKDNTKTSKAFSDLLVVTNTWNHVVVTWDGNLMRGYLNGIASSETESFVGPMNVTSEPLEIGYNPGHGGGAGGAYFDGIIDEVAIYNRALSADEIGQIYQPVPKPLFADAAGGDYHLKSERGRYWPAHDVWVLDDETSPCIDGGDPGIGPSNEPMPNGGRINMGAYGNTAYASMSEWPIKGDVNNDGRFNFMDIAILLDGWLQELGWAE